MAETGIRLFAARIESESEVASSLIAIRRLMEPLALDRFGVARLQAFVTRAWSFHSTGHSTGMAVALRFEPNTEPPGIEIEVRAARAEDAPLLPLDEFQFFSDRVQCSEDQSNVVLTGSFAAPDALVERFRSGHETEVRTAVARQTGSLLVVGAEEINRVLAQELRDGVTTTVELLSRQAQQQHEIDSLRTDLEDANREIAYLREEVESLTISDRLTGLFNRAKFDSVVETEIARAERQGLGFSLMLIDLDHFEEVNLRHGHHVGDEVLTEVGRLLSINTRKLVDSCFRFGGDEFAVILIGADARQSKAVAERILRAFRKVDKFGITLSMGLTSFQLEESKDALIARVDGAMYRAKQAGGNTVIDL